MVEYSLYFTMWRFMANEMYTRTAYYTEEHFIENESYTHSLKENDLKLEKQRKSVFLNRTLEDSHQADRPFGRGNAGVADRKTARNLLTKSIEKNPIRKFFKKMIDHIFVLFLMCCTSFMMASRSRRI